MEKKCSPSSSKRSCEAGAVNSQIELSTASGTTNTKESGIKENADSADRWQHPAQKRRLEASAAEDKDSAKKTKSEESAQMKEKTEMEKNDDTVSTTSRTQDLESASLAAGMVRVKFEAVWKGMVADFVHEHNIQDVYQKTAGELAEAVQLLESSGAAPVAEDGKVAGNVAARIVKDDLDILIVSKSGKQSGQAVSTDDDFCIITGFDPVEWTVNFYASSSSTLPTSDTPLHHAALHAAERFHWAEVPYISLHGHALETEDKAQQLGLPCSEKETLFSTPDDMHELVSLLKQYPFPLHKVFVRKGHGFLVLDKTPSETLESFKVNVMPFIA